MMPPATCPGRGITLCGLLLGYEEGGRGSTGAPDRGHLPPLALQGVPDLIGPEACAPEVHSDPPVIRDSGGGVLDSLDQVSLIGYERSIGNGFD
ncbi:hypothetical protein [Streptomyces sp. rh34]|uniref:hypothetical protein n=1 Tax=Streptomyces sp. rh34 TaxID=2034272 RepID=UPI00117C1C69|nr:hypothetical protein [Streptomyces sp. rh34]